VSRQAISPDQIARARTLIDPQFTHTPQFITAVPGFPAELLLKVETINPLRSFKGRGTDFLVASDPDRRPLACASAGNFGQGLALAGARRSREVHVFTARDINPLKARRMRALGAHVHIAEQDFDGAKEQAQQMALEHGWRFIEDGAEPRLAEGAGTIAAELETVSRWPDVIIAPVGNGSLINGVAAWAKHHHPETLLVAAGARGAPAMEHAWRTGTMDPGGSPKPSLTASRPGYRSPRRSPRCVGSSMSSTSSTTTPSSKRCDGCTSNMGWSVSRPVRRLWRSHWIWRSASPARLSRLPSAAATSIPPSSLATSPGKLWRPSRTANASTWLDGTKNPPWFTFSLTRKNSPGWCRCLPR
jgi:cysteine synthase